MYNPAFQLKILSMSIAGVNVLVFYTTMFKEVRTLGPGENAPLRGANRRWSVADLLDRCDRVRPAPDLLPPAGFHWCFLVLKEILSSLSPSLPF